ncbi:hypothetical protein L5515_019474 [Caenorhabditis briggsae]|uniref:Uncharacterized protein n=1 Tax=Caenorhabditis briggsae TaxID=6238 RepID=A0AAE9FKJ2_CAEBR|nr:hypothetical protein L5515_019474 [Caenorhabditis briggsae]
MSDSSEEEVIRDQVLVATLFIVCSGKACGNPAYSKCDEFLGRHTIPLNITFILFSSGILFHSVTSTAKDCHQSCNFATWFTNSKSTPVSPMKMKELFHDRTAIVAKHSDCCFEFVGLHVDNGTVDKLCHSYSVEQIETVIEQKMGKTPRRKFKQVLELFRKTLFANTT